MSQAVALLVSLHKMQGLNLRGLSFRGYFMVLLILSRQIRHSKCIYTLSQAYVARWRGFRAPVASTAMPEVSKLLEGPPHAGRVLGVVWTKRDTLPPPPKLGAWCEGEILTTSKPQQTGEATAWIWAKRPKRERNNSNKYFLIIYLLAQQPKGQNYSLNTTGWLSQWQPQGQLHRRHKKQRENTQNTSRKRVNKKIHPKITTKTILWNVKEKFVKLKFSYVHRSTHYVQFN